MRDITAELKELRLHGMAVAWADLLAQGTASIESSQWLIEHLLQAEATNRAIASVRHQMNAAKFPVHRDLAGFDFAASKVDGHLVKQLATLAFTDTAQNAVFIGGPEAATYCPRTAFDPGADLLSIRSQGWHDSRSDWSHQSR